MQTLVLENYGTVEMNQNEMKEVDGGFLGIVLAACALGAFLWGAANFVHDVVINHEQFDMTEW
jgi:lactobin A/cerein 7B family class IIb bacteriocin